MRSILVPLLLSSMLLTPVVGLAVPETAALATAGPPPAVMAVAPLPPEVAASVRADGFLDLDALRATGYQGGVNFPGLRLAPGRWMAADPGQAAPDKIAGDERWSGDFPVCAPQTIRDMCDWNGELVAISDHEVYRWSAGAWHALSIRTNGTLDCLGVHGGDLIVGGAFTLASGVVANRIVRYDGAAWMPLGLGFDQPVTALGRFGAQLIAAGPFEVAGTGFAPGIAAWNDTAWSPLGAGPAGEVTDFAEYGGRLIVAGTFHRVGAAIVNHIAAWDGANWSALQNGTGGDVRALAVHGGLLVAAGPFTSAGMVAADGVAAWNGAAWAPLGTDIGLNQWEYALMSAGGELYLAVQGTAHLRAARWDGTNWLDLIADTGMSLLGMCAVGSNTVFAVAAEGQTVVYISDGTNGIQAVGPGFDGDVLASTLWNGNLVVAGMFERAGGVDAMGIARWDGGQWSPLGSGLSHVDDGSHIRALASHQGYLVAAGTFGNIGGVSAANIARWNGIAWEPLGDGLGWGGTDQVNALLSAGGALYAGGDFEDYFWDTTVDDLAVYSSGAWFGLDGPYPYFGDGTVQCLAEYGSAIYIGGTRVPGGYSSGLARYQGGALEAFVGTQWEQVTAMQVFGGQLYVADHDGTLERWNGASWMHLLQEDPSVLIQSLAVHNGRLYAGGRFDLIGVGDNAPGIVDARNIVAFDGAAWERLGSGVGGVGSLENVKTLTDLTGTPWGLAVGGDFWHAGGREFRSLALWNEALSAQVPVPPGRDVARLEQNAPNPFNPQTEIRFEVPRAGPVRLRAYDLRGRLVATLVDGELPAGPGLARWDGRDDHGRAVASGAYVYRLETDGAVATRSMTLVR